MQKMVKKFMFLIQDQCGRCSRMPDGSCPSRHCAEHKVKQLIEASKETDDAKE